MGLESRRPGVLGVHSLDHFALTVPDLAVARDFYRTFGLDVRAVDGGLDIYAFGNPHRWLRITQDKRRTLQYISFGIFEDDMDRFRNHFAKLGLKTTPSREQSNRVIWTTDPNGIPIELRISEKSSPNAKATPSVPITALRNAPMRNEAPLVRPNRMSHGAFFMTDMEGALPFYLQALGLRLSDKSGPAAFLHGAHGSDHHMIAFIDSTAPGFHHCAWNVGSLNEVGLGATQMANAGHNAGWGLGRHALGSNYFHYVRDPWGSYCEYSFDMDYVAADTNWQTLEVPPENSLSLWGPPPPTDFIENVRESVL